MNKVFYIAIVSFLVVNCTSNTIIKKPDNLISKDQMVDLITDLAIATSAEHVKNLNLERNVNYFPQVFEKYHIDSTRFKESNYYYTSKIDEYDEILKKVEARLKALKKEFDTKRKLRDSLKRDSLDKAKKTLVDSKKEEIRK
tara:strand:- start:47 stop:472 length:426 start_codon:yes stop_codon:yes gene_type:complete